MMVAAASIPEDALQSVIGIAEAAGATILGFYRKQDLEVEEKSDGSPITEADKAAHDLIVRELASRFPYPILSEEAPVDFPERRHWARYWLVDPLDGTKDYIARNDEFTVNIALIDRGEPILGVVVVPALGLTYFAERGSGAYVRADGATRPIRNTRTGPPAICLDSRFHGSPKTRSFCDRVGITEIRAFGSALKLCRLAEGEADIYPRFNPTKEWDVAASHCILNEAGCMLIDMATLSEFSYNRPSVVNPPFIATRVNVECALERIIHDGQS